MTAIPRQFSLDAKYTQDEGLVYLSGIQALVRLPLDQHRADARRGLRTATFISGYRGSPLGGLDQTLERNQQAPGRAPRGLLLRAQRGPRRHRRLREPDGRLVPAAPLRRRPRHVVRQGPRGGPHRGRLQARELRGGGAERRRARPVRRRPHLQVVDLAEPLRGRALRRLHADDLSRQRAGDPRPRTPRLHAFPALRALGGRQDRHQRGRRDGDRRGLARTHPADRPHPESSTASPGSTRST